MNLVQIQERLKDAPVQAIMQYANGMNPMVPPYLALAELKRRESINQSAQAQQAMQQGQQPSVKEQVEQAAGLAALQQQMQQQGMQGLMAQARPAGIPENIPQPERQPESEGIAGLPAGDFNFADGGIVAFAGGDFVSYPDSAQARYKAAREKLMRYGLKQQKADPEGFAAAKEELQQAQLALQQAQSAWEQQATAAGLDRPIMSRSDIGAASRFAKQMESVQPPVAADDSYAKAEAARARARQQMVGFTGAEAPEGVPPATRMPGQLPPPGGIAGQIALPSRGAGAMPPGAPAEAPAAAPQMQPRGIAAIQGSDEAQKMMLETMRAKPTPESAFEAERKMAGLYGLTKPAGEERMQRAGQMEAERKRMLEERGMERLMRVMGGIAGRGLQGAGPAYLSAIEGERASDVAFRKQMDEVLAGVEEKRRAEATEGMQRATTQMGKERELSLGAAEKIFDAETRRKNEEFRIRLENQLRSMQPTEATILQRMIDDEMRRNPKLTLVEAYAKVKEAQQGATPEARARATQKDLLELALKEWNDQLIPMKDKNPRNLTQEQWLQEKMRTYGSAMPSGIGGGTGAQKTGTDVRSKANAILAGGR